MEANETEEIRTEAPEENGKQEEPKLTLAQEMYDWLEILVTALVSVALLFTLVACISKVNGASMTPTLLND